MGFEVNRRSIGTQLNIGEERYLITNMQSRSPAPPPLEGLPADQPVVVPAMTYTEYTLVDIAADDSVTLMAADGGVRNDLSLPDDTSNVGAGSFTRAVRENFESGLRLSIGVESAVGGEHIISMTPITAR